MVSRVRSCLIMDVTSSIVVSQKHVTPVIRMDYNKFLRVIGLESGRVMLELYKSRLYNMRLWEKPLQTSKVFNIPTF